MTQVKTEALGITNETGGMTLLYSGQIESSEQTTDEKTGEVLKMVQMVWMGGSKYFVVPLESDLANIAVGTKVLISQPQKAGKKGIYADRNKGITILTIGGKPVEQGRAA